MDHPECFRSRFSRDKLLQTTRETSWGSDKGDRGSDLRVEAEPDPGNLGLTGGGDGYAGIVLEQPSGAFGVPSKHGSMSLRREDCPPIVRLNIVSGIASS